MPRPIDIMDKQYKEIEKAYGKKAADEANYGWGQDGNEVATKVYVDPHQILTSWLNDKGKVEHLWSDMLDESDFDESEDDDESQRTLPEEQELEDSRSDETETPAPLDEDALKILRAIGSNTTKLPDIMRGTNLDAYVAMHQLGKMAGLGLVADWRDAGWQITARGRNWLKHPSNQPQRTLPEEQELEEDNDEEEGPDVSAWTDKQRAAMRGLARDALIESNNLKSTIERFKSEGKEELDDNFWNALDIIHGTGTDTEELVGEVLEVEEESDLTQQLVGWFNGGWSGQENNLDQLSDTSDMLRDVATRMLKLLGDGEPQRTLPEEQHLEHALTDSTIKILQSIERRNEENADKFTLISEIKNDTELDISTLVDHLHAMRNLKYIEDANEKDYTKPASWKITELGREKLHSIRGVQRTLPEEQELEETDELRRIFGHMHLTDEGSYVSERVLADELRVDQDHLHKVLESAQRMNLVESDIDDEDPTNTIWDLTLEGIHFIDRVSKRTLPEEQELEKGELDQLKELIEMNGLKTAPKYGGILIGDTGDFYAIDDPSGSVSLYRAVWNDDPDYEKVLASGVHDILVHLFGPQAKLSDEPSKRTLPEEQELEDKDSRTRLSEGLKDLRAEMASYRTETEESQFKEADHVNSFLDTVCGYGESIGDRTLRALRAIGKNDNIADAGLLADELVVTGEESIDSWKKLEDWIGRAEQLTQSVQRTLPEEQELEVDPNAAIAKLPRPLPHIARELMGRYPDWKLRASGGASEDDGWLIMNMNDEMVQRLSGTEEKFWQTYAITVDEDNPNQIVAHKENNEQDSEPVTEPFDMVSFGLDGLFKEMEKDNPYLFRAHERTLPEEQELEATSEQLTKVVPRFPPKAPALIERIIKGLDEFIETGDVQGTRMGETLFRDSAANLLLLMRDTRPWFRQVLREQGLGRWHSMPPRFAHDDETSITDEDRLFARSVDELETFQFINGVNPGGTDQDYINKAVKLRDSLMSVTPRGERTLPEEQELEDMQRLNFKPFTKEDWYGFSGSEVFASGEEPLLGQDEFQVTAEGMPPDVSAGATPVIDGKGVYIGVDYSPNHPPKQGHLGEDYDGNFWYQKNVSIESQAEAQQYIDELSEMGELTPEKLEAAGYEHGNFEPSWLPNMILRRASKEESQRTLPEEQELERMTPTRRNVVKDLLEGTTEGLAGATAHVRTRAERKQMETEQRLIYLKPEDVVQLKQIPEFEQIVQQGLAEIRGDQVWIMDTRVIPVIEDMLGMDIPQ